jgi:hypothetical protein
VLTRSRHISVACGVPSPSSTASTAAVALRHNHRRLFAVAQGLTAPAVRRYDTVSTSDLVHVYDELLRELHGPDYADQAETLHELEYVIRVRTGHDVRCSALRGGFDCDGWCDRR